MTPNPEVAAAPTMRETATGFSEFVRDGENSADPFITGNKRIEVGEGPLDFGEVSIGADFWPDRYGNRRLYVVYANPEL